MSKPKRPTAGWSRDEPWAQVAETHAAAVFLAGDLACKLKKPVNLGFLDFSTVAARTLACARETELNLRFAPDVYLDVAGRGRNRHRSRRHRRGGRRVRRPSGRGGPPSRPGVYLAPRPTVYAPRVTTTG